MYEQEKVPDRTTMTKERQGEGGGGGEDKGWPWKI